MEESGLGQGKFQPESIFIYSCPRISVEMRNVDRCEMRSMRNATSLGLVSPCRVAFERCCHHRRPIHADRVICARIHRRALFFLNVSMAASTCSA